MTNLIVTLADILEVWPKEANIPKNVLKQAFMKRLQEKHELGKAAPLSIKVDLEDVDWVAKTEGWPLPSFLVKAISQSIRKKAPRGRPPLLREAVHAEFEKMKASGELAEFRTKVSLATAIGRRLGRKTKSQMNMVGRLLTEEWRSHRRTNRGKERKMR